MIPANAVAAERLAPLLRENVARLDYEPWGVGHNAGGVGNLSFHTGVSSRLISDVLKGHREFIKIDALEKILTGLHLEHLSWYEASEGGFKDVYDRMKPPTERKRTREKKPKVPCPQCGEPKTKAAKLCAACKNVRTWEFTHCQGCETPFDRGDNKTGYCISCLHALGGYQGLRKTRGNAEYRKNIRHVMRRKGYGA